MEKALQLRDSRTTNVPVTVWTFNDSTEKAVGSLVQLLKELGYGTPAPGVHCPVRQRQPAPHGIQMGFGEAGAPIFPPLRLSSSLF
jgi:hypothetical protein